jgi:UDP-N-acetylmuramoylalanine--D-glutamate ligase
MKLILGLGDTGLSIARFLSSKGIEFRIADSRSDPPLLAKYIYHPAPILGEWVEDLLEDVDEVYISPGIAKSESIFVWASELGLPVVSDIELFSRYAKSTVVGITGSNGKSTVTKMLGNMIEQAGLKVAVGGNLGKPALDLISDEIEYYVLELSSYQLDYTSRLRLFAGVALNVTPDHLDRYKSFEDYKSSKLSIYDYCQHSIVNRDEAHTKDVTATKYFGMGIPQDATSFGTVVCHGGRYLLLGEESLMSADEMPLVGDHNITNALAAFTLGSVLGLPIDSMVSSIKLFKGLEHRLEMVGSINNTTYYNDSKATNAISAIKALQALVNSYEDIVLIAGGIAKNEDYSEFFKLINQKVSQVVLIGVSADYFASGIENEKVNFASSMTEAVKVANSLTKGGVVLLSPACASFDMFDNFEKRGEIFKEAVELLM